jgi:hypothetical protein
VAWRRNDQYRALFPFFKVLNLILVAPRRMVLLEQVPEKGYWYYVWEQDKRGREKEQEIKTIRELSNLKK